MPQGSETSIPNYNINSMGRTESSRSAFNPRWSPLPAKGGKLNAIDDALSASDERRSPGGLPLLAPSAGLPGRARGSRMRTGVNPSDSGRHIADAK